MPADSRTISVRITRPWADVAAFLGTPANFRQWASGLAGGLTLTAADPLVWEAASEAGPLHVRFSPPNPFGVADHWVTLPDGSTVYVPLRAMAHGADATDTLVSLTLFRLPDMDAARFEADAAWVARDLEQLQRVLEQPAAAR
ncbi:SRPBCC family protein [Imbroritus primus]|uniref:SRPBCC family protein n=1 Tax=Imbroritus primus TaxID=3058603 RepID=A0ACD3SM34_9BURK|nr:SRPBCC family protein [Burkholderiaceae bacterium PBA]